jgi:hypothetical protein
MFTTPVARDLDSLHPDKQRVQIEYAEQEYAAMQSMSSFLRERGATTVSGTALAEITLNAEGYRNPIVGVWLRKDGLRAYAGLLVVREQWTDHQLVFGTSTATISDDRYDAAVARRNKVYDSAGTALLWSDSRFVGVFGADGNARNVTSVTGNRTADTSRPRL